MRAVSRALGLAMALGVVACGSPEPAAPPPDPCTTLRAAYETARNGTPCAVDADCVPAPGITTRRSHASHRYEIAPAQSGDACAGAAHRDALAAVEAAAQAFASAGCGEVVPIGECNLPMTHGRDHPPICGHEDHQCAAVY